MKYLLVVTVVLVAFWIWRQNRRGGESHPEQAPARRTTAPQIMVSCKVCGTHLPQSDAVAGQHGAYCSQEHWAQAERR
jgi:uncharacterized protein